MDEGIITDLKAHAARESPRECCGLIVNIDTVSRYWPCRNMAGSDSHFAIDPMDYAAAEDAGEVLTVCHSHPFASPQPSEADRVSCEQSGLPWLIVNFPLGTSHEFAPSGYLAPLIGRTFVHAVTDCFSLLRDYYARTLRIDLPDFDRTERWWEKGGDLYRKHFAEAGFAPVPMADMREHDVILMQIRSKVPNHAAIYLGGNVILQHLQNRLSSRDIFGGYFRKNACLVLRHHKRP